MGRASLRAAVAALALTGPALAEIAVPAELPPKDFAGQQYVDSKGCLFVRAGQKGNESWIPRVTRDGAALCDNPPSGQRGAVADDDAEASPAAQAADP